MKQLCKRWLRIALALCTLSSCVSGGDIQVQDYVVGSYLGAAGGPVACVEVHTLFTDIKPAHYGLSACLQRMVGKVYMDGATVSAMQNNIDTMCTELGTCTYEQQQAMAYVKQALVQAQVARRHGK